MRFLHTSDWHLGRRLGEADRHEDHARALDDIARLCREAKVDALVVAGDVFDRAVPPVESVDLFGDFLTRCARDLKLPVVVAAGNHDSPERLGFGAELLAAAGVRLVTRLGQRTEPIEVAGTSLYVLPFAEPVAVRAALGLEENSDAAAEARSHDAAARAALAAMHARREPGRPAVLVAHMFVAGGQETADSERPLAVGGAGQVAISALGGWSYVALGHLHVAQHPGREATIRYAGSPLKLSFGEAKHDKGVTLVEIDDETGAATLEHVALTPRRDVQRIEGRFDELLSEPRYAHAEAAWVEATYTDTGYVVDAAARLRARFPHVLAARPRELLRHVAAEGLGDALRVQADEELLRGFWKYVGAGGELTSELEKAYLAALAAARAGTEESHLESLP